MSRNLGVPYTEKEPYYFISYNSEDEKRVAEYANALARLKVPMWYDNGIKIGSAWEREIAERIETCEAVIMFLSKNIFLKKDSYVHKEYELATEFSGKQVYVMMLDKIQKPEVPVQFRAWWIDVTAHQCINTYEYSSANECAHILAENLGIKPSLYDDGDDYAQEVKNSSGNKSRKKIEYENGDIYDGDIVDGKRTGKGRYTWADGGYYDGDWVDDKRTGKGKVVWKSGDIYEGDIKDGVPDGKGIYTWSNGDVYDGDWVNYDKTGKGRYVSANGNIYEGDFENGVFDGFGIYTWKDGGTYEGTWIKGKRTGYGKYFWPNGSRYEGEFEDGALSGKGKHTDANGNVREGIWEKGVFKG